MVPRIASSVYMCTYGSMPAARNAKMSTNVIPVCTADAMCGEPCLGCVAPMVFCSLFERPSRPSA